MPSKPTEFQNGGRLRAILDRPDKGQVTKDFNLTEFRCHDGSYPPLAAHAAIASLCRIFLQPLRAKFGPCIVLSGYRHRDYNQAIGGVLNSQHIYELTPLSVAADVRFANGNPRKWASAARWLRLRRNRNRGGIGTYVRHGFVHIDNRPYRASWRG